MKILCHHIYEYKKGLRNLVLCTLRSNLMDIAIDRLEKGKIAYLVQAVNENKINIFFGNKECVDIVASFGEKPLTDFSDEEDFILGIMLGYSRLEQCKRYNKRKRFRRVRIPSIKRDQIN